MLAWEEAAVRWAGGGGGSGGDGGDGEGGGGGDIEISGGTYDYERARRTLDIAGHLY